MYYSILFDVHRIELTLWYPSIYLLLSLPLCFHLLLLLLFSFSFCFSLSLNLLFFLLFFFIRLRFLLLSLSFLTLLLFIFFYPSSFILIPILLLVCLLHAVFLVLSHWVYAERREAARAREARDILNRVRFYSSEIESGEFR